MKHLSARQKRFAELVHQGIPPYRAYPQAGYAANDGSPYRLQGNARVKAYIGQLEARAMKKHDITVDKIVEMLEEARQNAKAYKQPASEIGAAMSMAKLAGLVTDKSEVKQISEMTKEETIDAIRQAYMAMPAQERAGYVSFLKASGVEESTIAEMTREGQEENALRQPDKQDEGGEEKASADEEKKQVLASPGPHHPGSGALN
jgi:hypothetical protein